MRQLRIAVAQTVEKIRELLAALEAMDNEGERPLPEFRRAEEFSPDAEFWLEIDKATAAAARSLRRLRAVQAMKPRRSPDDEFCETPIDDDMPRA